MNEQIKNGTHELLLEGNIQIKAAQKIRPQFHKYWNKNNFYSERTCKNCKNLRQSKPY
jgi:hypothetical protein